MQVYREILAREVIVSRTLVKIFGLFTFIICTALGAYVRIPLTFTPVPITLQTFFVLLSGAVLGKRWGAASQTGYVLLGALGLPIFAQASYGVAYLFGPTGGYLLGFVFTSWIVGWMIARQTQSSISRITLAMIIGSFAGIYLFGLVGLQVFLRCSLTQALALGFFPFVPGDVLKIIGAALLYRKVEGRCRQVFG